jgi:GTP-binding protein Era
MPDMPPLPEYRESNDGYVGMVAIVGRTNTGKSTLLNRIVGEKVSIVSPVVQTTRNLIRAILTEERGQLVFLDTPGLHRATHDLGRIMNRTARAATEGVDVCLLVLDSAVPPRDEDESWIRRLVKDGCTCLAALNKSDLGGPHAAAYRELHRQIADSKDIHGTWEWVEISAQNGAGVDHLVEKLFHAMPSGPLLFPPDILTDFPRKLAISDMIRERLFEQLRQELPHAVAVNIAQIDEKPDGQWDIYADIYVDRPSQKGIVIGNKGRNLKRVRKLAEKDVEAAYEHPVTLNLWVKIEKNWAKNFWILRELGYV